VTDPSDVRDAAGFVQTLRALKVWAGDPSFKDLERRSGLPRSTLADALNPRRRQLPRLEVVRAFVAACGVSDCGPWDEAWRRAHLDSSPLAVVPRELPPDVVGFAGRSADLAGLDEVHPVIVVCGTAGVGKTALAVHWAHRHVDRFPDGQLYLNLRGYDAGPAVTVADAAGQLLHSLLPAGVPIPPDEHARVSLLRSLAVDRRILIVLDNASSAAQVRPLLVAGAGCRVIVTSRDALPGLVARDGASRVVLDVLSPSESVVLLASFVDSPSSGLAELARRCAYLPLGLRVAGELVADGSLAPSFDDLDAGGDEETSLRTVFSWSYTRLPADAARAFRLLGAHPGREYDVYAVAALASLSLPDARALVRVLRRAHLLEERSPDRYTMHDLLHAYAVSLAADASVDESAAAARARLVDYYIWGATIGHRLLHAYDVRPLADIPPRPPFAVPELATPDAALAWLDTERANLIAAVGSDVAAGQVIDSANALDRYLNHGAHYPENLAVMQAALTAARSVSDRAAEARALCALGRIYGQTSNQTAAIDSLLGACSIAVEVADRATLHSAMNSLGCVYYDRGDYEQAVQYLERAIVLGKGDGPWAEATGLGNLGMCYDTTGRYQEALGMYERALAKHREARNRRGEGRIFESIGSAYLRHGRHQESIDYLMRSREIATEVHDTANHPAIMNSLGNAFVATQRIGEAAAQHESALLLARQIGDRLETVRALDGLGDVAFAQGDRTEARARWDEAYDLALEIGVSLADDVRRKLDGLDTSEPSAG
jgi:tetratricopeptide (TPR) repeat protein